MCGEHQNWLFFGTAQTRGPKKATAKTGLGANSTGKSRLCVARKLPPVRALDSLTRPSQNEAKCSLCFCVSSCARQTMPKESGAGTRNERGRREFKRTKQSTRHTPLPAYYGIRVLIRPATPQPQPSVPAPSLRSGPVRPPGPPTCVPSAVKYQHRSASASPAATRTRPATSRWRRDA
jgi:hypothetical protein